MASIMVSVIIDGLEEDTDMESIADSVEQLVKKAFPYNTVDLNEWEA